MNLLTEIRNGFANLDIRGGMLRIIALGDDFPAWIFREGEVFGVALEISHSHSVSERFAGARLATAERVFSGEQRHLLRLESSRQSLRNEFAVVCAQMVAPGEGGAYRQALISDPHGWWENWRQLLGNAIVNQSSYAVLGELLALELLIERGKTPDWTGPVGGSVDIETTDAGYEVKSTLTRYDSVVHISGQFQLATSEMRKLYLVHQRFEPSSTGDSIDSVVNRLIAKGQKPDEIENLVSCCGLEAGSAARAEKFKLIDSNLFEIDDTFPKITPRSFVGGIIPLSVVSIEYQVDLSGLAHASF